MTIPSLREIVHAMLLSTLFALCGELINGSLALRLLDFQPEAHPPVARTRRRKRGLCRDHICQADDKARTTYYYFAFSQAQ